MENIPAFKEEANMTAKSNFLAAVYFELSEVHHFDGRVDKITKEWKNTDIEVRTDPKGGGQLKKGKDVIGPIETQLKTISDPLEKAKQIIFPSAVSSASTTEWSSIKLLTSQVYR